VPVVDEKGEEVSEEDLVLAWRIEQLLGLGFSDIQAMALALSPDVDLAQVRSLARAGCEHTTLFRIVV